MRGGEETLTAPCLYLWRHSAFGTALPAPEGNKPSVIGVCNLSFHSVCLSQQTLRGKVAEWYQDSGLAKFLKSYFQCISIQPINKAWQFYFYMMGFFFNNTVHNSVYLQLKWHTKWDCATWTRQNWDITVTSTWGSLSQTGFFPLTRWNLSENVHNENTVPSFHDAYVSIFHYLPTLLTAPSVPPPHSLLHGSDASFNHYTKSAFMHTTPLSLCSFALTDTRGPSQRISTILLTTDI